MNLWERGILLPFPLLPSLSLFSVCLLSLLSPTPFLSLCSPIVPKTSLPMHPFSSQFTPKQCLPRAALRLVPSWNLHCHSTQWLESRRATLDVLVMAGPPGSMLAAMMMGGCCLKLTNASLATWNWADNGNGGGGG